MTYEEFQDEIKLRLIIPNSDDGKCILISDKELLLELWRRREIAERTMFTDKSKSPIISVKKFVGYYYLYRPLPQFGVFFLRQKIPGASVLDLDNPKHCKML